MTKFTIDQWGWRNLKATARLKNRTQRFDDSCQSHQDQSHSRITQGEAMAPHRNTSRALVRDGRREKGAREMRQALFQRCRAAAEQVGDQIAGFAIVVWDERGDMRSAYDATRGPIGPALVPTLVSDALNRHVAVKMAEERLADNGDS